MMSGYGLAVDQEGNTFFTGHMYQSFVFGNLAFSDSGLVLAKCDQAGNPLWAVREEQIYRDIFVRRGLYGGRIMSGYGGTLFELGVLGLTIPVVMTDR